jgi:hypothetical protein
MQVINDIRYPMGRVASWGYIAIKGLEQGSRVKPHLVQKEVGKGAKGKGKDPCFPVSPVDVKSGKGRSRAKTSE